MELIDQRTKRIMEGCKERAREVGLCFHDETLEYIVTNKDLIELGPKNMIPTLYDYWVHDVEVLKERGKYELYPHNPYETVINTRPAISFYNDNNPDWLNVMIFYHVLAHIDFFQNNGMFRNTWKIDFNGQALSDKRTIAQLRSEKGRWVDYVIEFTRGIDNLVGYFNELARSDELAEPAVVLTKKLDYYFDVFLQEVAKKSTSDYMKEMDRYNEILRQMPEATPEMVEPIFMGEVIAKHPEFQSLYEKYRERRQRKPVDLMEYLQQRSEFLQKEDNKWMKTVMEIVRKTSLFFQPQIRTKIMNEGWASYWHEELFLSDPRIKGNETSFAKVNAMVTALPRVGINPYALGMRLFSHIKEQADKGRLSYDFQKLANVEQRKAYDQKAGNGLDAIFRICRDFNDFWFLKTFVDQDFVDRHKLFVAGRRPNKAKGVWEYYVKSRDAGEYRQMLLNSLYHPPTIEVDEEKTQDGCLYLKHRFEGKGLVREFLKNTMLGIAYLWNGKVCLETSDPVMPEGQSDDSDEEPIILWRRVRWSYDWPSKEWQWDLV